MLFSIKSTEGYLMVDHRASPGLPPEIARLAGYDPFFCQEGKVYESATLGCCHCGGAYVKNPFRTRERASCIKCEGRYVCDTCDAVRALPDYVHKSFDAIAEAVNSGRFVVTGTSSQPNLQPVTIYKPGE